MAVILASVGAALVLSGPSAGIAYAGGTAVVAPEHPAEADCAAGSRPRVRGFDPGVMVLGCAALRRPVLGAAGREAHGTHGLACFYAAPAGGRDTGRCYELGPWSSHRARFPVAGADGIEALTIGALDDRAAFAIVQASERVGSVAFRARADDGSPIRIPGVALAVERGLADRLGAPAPFAFFAGEIPSSADLCRGVGATAHDQAGERVGTTAFERGLVQVAGTGARAGIALPGSRRCARAGVAAGVDRLAAQIDASIRSLARGFLRLFA